MVHGLRRILRLAAGRNVQPSAAIFDSRTEQSTPESGVPAGYDGVKKREGSKIHLTVDTLGYLLGLHVTPANEQDRAQVGELCQQIQEMTSENIELVFVDAGYTGEQAAIAAEEHGVELQVVKLDEMKRGFVLMPQRWVIERSFAWTARFRHLARDYERLPQTVSGLHFVAFAILMLARMVQLAVQSS